MRHMTRTAVVLGFVTMVLVVGTLAQGEKPPGARPPVTHPGFERLRQLAGEWIAAEPGGEAGSPKGAGEVVVSYKVTAGDSVVQETLFPGTPHEMVTMYHLDGTDLVLTHYCALGNQPRMKAEPSADASKLVFKFAGGTNIDPAKDGHMHELTLTFSDANHLRSEWTLYQDGKKSDVKVFELKRPRG
jgi:hypothetical protein